MKKNSKLSKAEIRRQAEARLSEKKEKTQPLTKSDTTRIIYELQVHQIEMEMQNEELMQAWAEVEEAYRQYTDLYDFAPMGYLTMARDGTIRQSNLAGSNMLGVKPTELSQRRLGLFVSSESRQAFNIFFEKLLSGKGKEACELKFEKKGNETIWVRLEATCFEGGDACRAMMTDITERKQIAFLLQARMRISEFVESHTLDELLQKTLDEAEALTGSQIGFAHFLEADQNTLHLQTWSTNTLKNMCTAEGKGSHYPVDQAGVWADCVSTRAPLIHNDYPSLPASRRKGLPQGHTPVLREVVVPVLRNDLIVMIMGVGNKSTDYDEKDVEIMSQLANSTWDIIQRKRAEEALKASTEFANNLIASMQDGVSVLDKNGVHLDVNSALCRITGFSREELIGTGIPHLYWPLEEYEHIQAAFQQTLASEFSNFELTFRRKNGERFPVIVSPFAVKDALGRTISYSATIKDITERVQAEQALRQSEEKYRTVANFTYDWEAWRGPDGAYLYVSPSCERVTGHTPVEFSADSNLILKITHPNDQSKVREHFDISYNESKRDDLHLDFRIIRPDGQTRWIAHHSTPVYGENGQWLGRRDSNRDMTERKLGEIELQYMKEGLNKANFELQAALVREKQLAHTDPLTGINNRRYLYELAEHEYEIAARYQQPLSMIMFDIDHFKGINDTFGHAAGDQILQSVTQVACAELRSADIIGRYGGEEFVIVLPMTNAQQAYPLAERIRIEVAAMRVPTEKGEARVTLSIGIIEMLRGAQTGSAETLIKNADKAMYAAKQAGRNRTIIGEQ